MTPTGRSRATHRLAALLVGVFWCAAPILAAVHANAEVHRYCAEHGMVEEAAAASAARPADESAAHDASERPPAHDGCAFAKVCRFGQVLASFVLPVAGALDPTPVATPALAQAAPPLALLRLAPKTSPPV
jgi:hypothetical protein